MDEVRRQLLGAWRVTSYDDRSSAEEPWTATYGDDVDGLIVYDGSGWVSVTVSGAGRFDSYFGRFALIDAIAEADGVVGTLEHTVVASNMPGMLTADRDRPFRLHDDTLVLGDGELWRRVCRRL